MRRSLRVLIVEDSPDDAELILLALRRGGLDPTWERVETADGLHAALAAGSWDAVLSDYTMPTFGAAAALDIVREFDPDLPCLVVSGTVGEELAVAMMRAGANDYVLKDNLTRLAPALSRELEQADHRRARREAEQAAARLAAIVSGADYAIISQTLDGVITSWNAGAERLYGYAAEEAVGRHASFLLPPDDTELDTARGRVTHGGSVPAFDAVRVHKDGHRLDVSVSLAPIRDAAGRIVGMSGIGTDISERKRGERERQLLLSIIECSPDFVGIAHVDERVVFVNHAGQNMVGLQGGAEVGRTSITDYIAGADRERLTKEVLPVLRASGHVSGEIAFRHFQTGSAIPTEWNAFAVPDPDTGAPAYFACVAHDITDRKRAADDLRRTTDLLQAVANGTPDAVFVKDLRGRYLLCNPAAAEFMGRSPSDVIGGTDAEFFDPESARRAMDNDRRVLQSGQTVTSEEELTAAGVTRTYSATKAPYRDAAGNVIGVIGISRDITEQKRAEEALRLRDRAIQAVTQGILICNATESDCPITYASPGFERLTGYTSEEVVGRNCRFLQGTNTDPTAVAQLRVAIRAGEPRTVELLNYRKDGAPFWNELSISPVRDPDGRLTHFVGVQTDVTARRNLEEQFRQVQKMEAVGQLAAGVAHDFNNLLTIINGYSDLLLQGRSTSDPSWELLAEIHKAGERSAGLTRQLLAFSRQQVMTLRVLNLNEVVADTEKMLRRLIGEDVRLVTTLAPELWPVQADPGQIEQVLLNLAVNARDAMPRGGQLTIETRNVELDDSYARTHPDAGVGPHVFLRVTDTGVGMSPEVRARIFEPFFTTKEPGKGTGLGLATVYGIVKQSGGHITVESEIGVGTTFEVYLPRTDKPGGSNLRPGLLATRGTETILLVEDEAGVRTLTRHVLAGCGYTVLEAADGEEAVRIASSWTEAIHLLITDVVMPGIGGRVVAERITKLHPKVRVLFVSGYTDDAILRHGVSREAVYFLPKPYSPAALAFKTREVLDAPT